MLVMTVLCYFSDLYAQNNGLSLYPLEAETISNTLVRCFHKDSKGFMWIGTGDGLYRYDGTNAYLYENNPEDTNSIGHNNINVIVEDQQQKIWVGTSKGLCLFNREKDNFTNLNDIAGNKNHLNNNYITSVAFDNFNNVWIGTHGGGINVYDIQEKNFTFLGEDLDEKPTPSKNYINTLLPVGDIMWSGTKGGIIFFNLKNKAPMSLTYMEENFPNGQVTQLIMDAENNIWSSMLNGDIIKIDANDSGYKIEKVITANQVDGGYWGNILSLSLDKKGSIWIGGENSGLAQYNIRTKKITRFLPKKKNDEKIPTNSVRTVYVDDAGLIWVGTFNKGAFLMNNKGNKFWNDNLGDFGNSEFTGKDVTSFAEDPQGNIWIAFGGTGFKKIDSNKNEIQTPTEINRKLSNKTLTKHIFDCEGNLWAGTYGNGIFNIDPTTNRIIKQYALQSDGFGDNKISCIYEDKNGKIWVGTFGSGLFYLDKVQQNFVSLHEKEKPIYITNTSYITSLLEDSDGVFWVGTMFGLYALKETSINTYLYALFINENRPESLSSNSVQSILEDNKGNLWIGTHDKGLNYLNRSTGEFKVIQKRHGLASNSIRSLQQDSDGNLWISSNNGLTKYSINNNEFTTYSKKNGLVSDNFIGNSSLKTRNGELFFGSYDGFNTFFPDSIQINSERPKVYLSDLKINNRSAIIGAADSPLKKHIGLTSKIILPYEKRSFVIDFVAIHFGLSDQHNYCYKLEGFDKDWNCIGTNTSATYTNIDPGNYVFLVKASNKDGVWSASPARLEIKIRQLPWKSWWAICLYVIFCASGSFFLIKIIMEKTRMKHQLDLERHSRKRELELSESKTQFFTNISHELRTPLSLISLPLEYLIEEKELPSTVKKRLGTIHTNANKMTRLVNELMDFSKLESAQLKLKVQRSELISFITGITTVFNDLAEKRKIEFGINSKIQEAEGWVDHDKLEKILANILSNAFKFTPDHGRILVTIDIKDPNSGKATERSRLLEVKVIDNGIGISKEELPFIFEKFYQAKSSQKITNKGTGIGLSLSKGLLELHHGNIEVESIPDQETIFVLTLPIDRNAYLESEVDESNNNLSVLENNLVSEADFLSKQQLLKPNLEKSKILVIEDNEELRNYIVMELRHYFEVIEAQNGLQGMELATTLHPDLIISDILMPLKSGIELCHELKSNLKTSHIPIILLTSKTTLEEQITGIYSGADHYITKPFNMRYLVVQANQIIETRQKLYCRFSQDVYLMPSKVATNDIDQAFLQKAIDFIIDNMLDSQLGVDAIAGLFNLSRMQVYRKIKALTGKSVVDFIRMVRIKQALLLMNSQKHTISEVAYLTGFNSASYFTKCFKDHFGKAPSEYLENKT